MCYYNIQWAPLIAAGALFPVLGWVGAAKPNLGLAAFAYRPNWWTVVGGTLLVVLAFFLVPAWPLGWLAHIRMQPLPHTAPLMWPFGAVALLGLLRWRTPEGRLLAAMAVLPSAAQVYDHLLVWLVPKGWRETLALTVAAWIGHLVLLATAPHDLTRDARPAHWAISLGVYVPATVLVLRRRNGAAPSS